MRYVEVLHLIKQANDFVGISPNSDIMQPDVSYKEADPQRAQQLRAFNQGFTDHLANTSAAQYGRNAVAATAGAVTGVANGMLSIPTTAANFMAYGINEGLGALGVDTSNYNVYNGTRAVTNAMHNTLKAPSNWVSQNVGAQQGVNNAAVNTATTLTELTATPSATSAALTSKPIVAAGNKMIQATNRATPIIRRIGQGAKKIGQKYMATTGPMNLVNTAGDTGMGFFAPTH